MSDIHGAIWWNELMTHDVARAQAYYRRICGWRYQTTPAADGGDYHVAYLGAQPVAGMLDISTIAHHADTPSQWITYLAVDDLDAALERTEAAGGRIGRAPFEVPGVGRIAIVHDTVDGLVGLITPVQAG
jgi:uncharacterized protein